MIKNVYPGTAYTCLLDATGDVLVQIVEQAPSGFGPVNTNELASVLTTLRRSIALFGTMLYAFK
ncbi:hypothetical protein THRCLA_22483 [Thraustotheca clavata]|uniref:Uncharacterized protein n=1 Tax=Thraustotheca clavata TaxID=74557 RepID=A0A1V9YZK0_9STRA|nr:hypothetical protein THRCLA_22483 [Thraustotheca clavata]